MKPAAIMPSWRYVSIAAAVIVLSIPIQTGGLGPYFLDFCRFAGLSETQLSVILAVATIVAGPLIRYPILMLSRFGLKRYTLINMLMLALGVACLSQLPRFSTLPMVGLILLLGGFFVLVRLVGQGGCNLLCNEILARRVPEAPARAAVIVNLGVAAAFVIAPAILAEMQLRLSFEFGWIVLSFTIFFGGLLCYRIIIFEEPTVAEDEALLEPEKPNGHADSMDWASWVAAAMMFSVGLAFAGVGVLGASLANWHGMEPIHYFRLFALMMPFQLAACLWCGRSIERRKLRFCYLQLLVGATCGMLGLLFLAHPVGKVIFVLGFSFALGAFGPLHTVTAFVLAGSHTSMRDRFNGRVIMGATIGGALGPLFFSYLRDLSGSFLAVVLAMVAVFMACMLMLVSIPNR